MSQLMRLWYLSHRRPAKDQARLRIRAVSPETSLFAHMKHECRQMVRPKCVTSSPTGWLRMHVWRMSLWRTKSTIISYSGSINNKITVSIHRYSGRWQLKHVPCSHLYQWHCMTHWDMKLQLLFSIRVSRNEPPHDKTNITTVHPAKTQISLTVHPAKTQISLDICLVWSEYSLCTQWVAKEPSFLHADSKDSDQTGQMPRLISVFAGCSYHFVGFCHEAAQTFWQNKTHRIGGSPEW